MNGYMDHPSGSQSPLVKSPLSMTSPLMKNTPSLPSPLIKNSMDMPPYMGNGVSSPFQKVDRGYRDYYDKMNSEYSTRRGSYQRSYSNGDFGRHPSSGTDYSRGNSGEFSPFCPRNSLSEYTQQCQQANQEFQQHCQRQSSSSEEFIGHNIQQQRPSSAEYPHSQQRASCDYYSCRHNSDEFPHSHSQSEYPNRSIPPNYQYMNGNKEYGHIPINSNHENSNHDRDYNHMVPERPPPNHMVPDRLHNGFSDNSCLQDYSMPCEGGEYPSSLAASINQNCMERPLANSGMASQTRNNFQYESSSRPSSCEYLSRPGGPFPGKLNSRGEHESFKTPVSIDTSEQTVPNITLVMSDSPDEGSKGNEFNFGTHPPIGNPPINPLHARVKSNGSASETELSDCVFQNENSRNSNMSPVVPTVASTLPHSSSHTPTLNIKEEEGLQPLKIDCDHSVLAPSSVNVTSSSTLDNNVPMSSCASSSSCSVPSCSSSTSDVSPVNTTKQSTFFGE